MACVCSILQQQQIITVTVFAGMVKCVGLLLTMLCAACPGSCEWLGCHCSECLGALASFLLRLQDRLQPAHSSPAPAWMAGDDLAKQTEPEGFISVPFLPAKKSLGSFRRHP